MLKMDELRLKEKNIVFIINTLRVGGAAKMLRFVAEICTAQFRDVKIITLFDKNESDCKVPRGINVINLGLTTQNKGWRISAIPLLRRTIKQLNPDAVCAFISDVAVLSRVSLLGKRDFKFISAERGDPYTERWYWKILIRWAYSCSDACFFQLEGARDYFGKYIAKKSYVIPNPFFDDNNILYGSVRHNKTIVSAGRFEIEKGFDVLISAFQIVHNKYPDYRLRLFGKGSQTDKYIDLVRKLKLQDSVVFCGYSDNLKKEISEDGVFVLPSRYEGMPNVLMEAMSVGLPCVSTNCTPGGPAYLLQNGENGILVDIDDSISMANAIIQLIENPECAKGYVSKAKLFIDSLDDESISGKWRAAFADVINC